VRNYLRTAFSIAALLTACLAPPALTRAERHALARALRRGAFAETRAHELDGQSFEAFAFVVLGLDYQWKIVCVSLAVPLAAPA